MRVHGIGKIECMHLRFLPIVAVGFWALMQLVVLFFSTTIIWSSDLTQPCFVSVFRFRHPYRNKLFLVSSRRVKVEERTVQGDP